MVLGLVAVLVLATFRDYGISWDEPGQDTYGRLLFAYHASQWTDRSVFGFANLYYYGGAFDLLAEVAHHFSPWGRFETRHLLGGLIGLLGLAGTWRLGRLAAGRRAGLLALIPLAATPAYYGHMFINHKDLPFAAGMIWTTYFLCRVIGQWPRVEMATASWLGLAAGLTLSSRVGGLMAAAYPAGAFLLWGAGRARTDGMRETLRASRQGLTALLPGLAIALPVTGLAWPWVWQDPLNPWRALTMFSHFPFDGQVLFAGQLYPAANLPWYYLPWSMAVTLPEIFLPALALACCLGMKSLIQPPGLRNAPPTWISLTVLTAAVLPLALDFGLSPVLYNGIRHFLFVLPPLAVVVGFGLDRLLKALSPGKTRWLAALILAAGLAWPTWAAVKLHPYQYIFFNLLVGGPHGAEGRYELDYWGTSLAEAGGFLADYARRTGSLPARPWRVTVCGEWTGAANHWPPGLFQPDTERPDTGHPPDFAIMLNQFYCQPPPDTPVYEVRRMGAILCRVYDRRPAMTHR